MIPRFAPTYTYEDLWISLAKSIRSNPSEELRYRLAELYRVKHVFLLESARVALFVLLKAYSRPGGVLMPAYNCIAVPEAVHFAGYRPVFIDLDEDSLNVSVDSMTRLISDDISVVLLTHLFGIPCEVSELLDVFRGQDVLVVEDAAPALGAEYRGRLVGTFGDAAIISFHSTKVISGEVGGALLVKDDELAGKITSLLQATFIANGCLNLFPKTFIRKVATNPKIYPMTQLGYRLLRNEDPYEVVQPQTKKPSKFLSSCPSYASSLILAQFDRLEWNLRRRRKIANIYIEGLSNLPEVKLPKIPKECSPAWIQFPIFTENKQSFYKFMQRHNIDVTWTYRYSCAESYEQEGFPNARRAALTVLGLPTYPMISDDLAQAVCQVARKYPHG